MARKAKTVEIISEFGEVVETTIKQFLEDNPEIIRSHLYKAQGAKDANGNQWRIGEAPVIVQRVATQDAMGRLRYLLEGWNEEEDKTDPHAVMLEEAIRYWFKFHIPVKYRATGSLRNWTVSMEMVQVSEDAFQFSYKGLSQKEADPENVSIFYLPQL